MARECQVLVSFMIELPRKHRSQHKISKTYRKMSWLWNAEFELSQASAPEIRGTRQGIDQSQKHCIIYLCHANQKIIPQNRGNPKITCLQLLVWKVIFGDFLYGVFAYSPPPSIHLQWSTPWRYFLCGLYEESFLNLDEPGTDILFWCLHKLRMMPCR